MENKYYYLIVSAKKVVEEALKDNDIEDIINGLHGCWGRKTEPSINKRAALATVIMCGGVYNGQFMMPSTRDCLDCFRYIRKLLSDGRKAAVAFEYEYRYNGGEYTSAWTDLVRLF